MVSRYCITASLYGMVTFIPLKSALCINASRADLSISTSSYGSPESIPCMSFEKLCPRRSPISPYFILFQIICSAGACQHIAENYCHKAADHYANPADNCRIVAALEVQGLVLPSNVVDRLLLLCN